MEEIPREQMPCPDAQRLPTDSVRARILRRFEVWLDEALAEEAPPSGVAQEILALQDDSQASESPDVDFYSLVAGFTTLSEETRLQGRSFKALQESLGPMGELVESVSRTLQRLEQTQDRREQEARDGQRHACLGEVMEVLLDVRDRLTRGRDTVRSGLDRYPEPQGGWAAWRLKPWAELRQTVTALIEGSDLALGRLDVTLRQWGVQPIECVRFDPACMKAVEVTADPAREDGEILEVYRTGYTWDEQVLRWAEVKVVRNTTTS